MENTFIISAIPIKKQGPVYLSVLFFDKYDEKLDILLHFIFIDPFSLSELYYVMPFLLSLKPFFKAAVTVVNNFPRKHLFVLILLFVFVLIVSIIPTQPKTPKKIYRSLELPESIVVEDEHAPIDPLATIKNN